ncbi:MAG: serine hydrolase [Planctomycetota bacterium]
MGRTFDISLVCLLIVFVSLAEGIPSDVDREILFRIDNGYNVGVIVAITDNNETSYHAYGRTSLSGSAKPDESTVFEIGSITKVFTSLMLAEMVETGSMSLRDPIWKYLPENVRCPAVDGNEINLSHLATHTSGLPRLPDNLAPADMNNPYADYNVKLMYEFLANYTLQRKAGQRYEYSNFGGGLLGHILARRSGTTYYQLCRRLVTAPLGMNDTSVRLSAEVENLMAVGYADSVKTPNWKFDALAGAGALRSTARDMVKFLRANMGLEKTPLLNAMQNTHVPRVDTDMPNMKIGLAWHILKTDNAEIVWHNGGTGGFRSFIGFVRDRKLGVVVLANSSQSVDDIGFHLLDSAVPLASLRESLAVAPNILKGYIGKYELIPGTVFDIAVKDNQLTAELTGQPRFTIYPQSTDKFFYKVVDAQITFVRDANNMVQALILYQNGINQTAIRVGSDYKVPGQKQEVGVSLEVLKAYVGKYQLAPAFVFDIAIQNNQLTAQLTGQPRLPIYPESEDKFFYKVVDAQITFVKDANGNVSSLVLHQLGMNQSAKKIE